MKKYIDVINAHLKKMFWLTEIKKAILGINYLITSEFIHPTNHTGKGIWHYGMNKKETLRPNFRNKSLGIELHEHELH